MTWKPSRLPDEQARRRQRSGRRNWFRSLPLFLVGLVMCLYTIPRFLFGPFQLYSNLPADQRSNRITYEKLTDESTVPYSTGFLPRGTTPPSHKDAVARFPGVQNCLIPSEQTTESPDLRLIDWNLILTDEEADVCIWRIFSSLGTSDRAFEWLRFQGLRPRTINFLGSTGSGRRFEQKRQIDVSGGLMTKSEGVIFPTKGLIRVWIYLIAYSQNIQSVWNEKGDHLIRVQVGANIL